MVQLLILLLVLVLVVLPIVALFRIVALGRRNEELEQRLRALEREVRAQRDGAAQSGTFASSAGTITPPLGTAPASPPVLFPPTPPTTASERDSVKAIPGVPVMAPTKPLPGATAPPRFDWEQFTGVKLLAWTGGAAAFLGAAFFIKYSFEHDLISPAMRVTIGYVFALALVFGGLRIPRPRYAPTAQTVCATGIVCLYAVTFACSSIYAFALFTPFRTFLLMALITAGAFVLAVRLGARVVAGLGMLGGFLTPVLLATGRDNAFGLFGYIALLDIGLVALALHQRWHFLVPLGAAGTVGLQLHWAVKFLAAAKVPTAMVISLVFCALFLGAYLIARRFTRQATAGAPAVAPAVPSPFYWPAVALPCVALLFAIGFIAYPAIGARPGLLFSFVSVAAACLLAIAWFDVDSPRPHAVPRALRASWLPACALAGVALVEYAWDGRHVTHRFATPPLAWAMIFYALFTVFPFVFRSRFAALTGPWATAALAGVAHFPLIYRISQRAAPNDMMGLVPALFALAPSLSMLAVFRSPNVDERARLNQLAWFGGVALLFITLVVPIQFERQWVTLGWALEGVALLWLFRRVPHPGLRATGVVLLAAAFARLAVNPAVLTYHARSATPILNWYLYTYGIVTACLFVGANLVSENRSRTRGIGGRPLLNALGTILAFLLLNLQIADFFSPPGTRVLTFQFSGDFGRDMTYTIAWALFALGLLLISIGKRTRAGRYAALALLGVAVLKLFVHDLERLGALHRIGALFAVAIIAIAASLAYQRFLPGDDSSASKR